MIKRVRALVAILLCTVSGPALADTLIDNVNGVTLDREGRVVRFTGLVIDKDGRVSQLFKGKEKRPKRPDYFVDGKGRVLVPGMVDSNVHLMSIGLALLTPEDRAKAAAEAGAYGQDSTTPPAPGRAVPYVRPEDRDLALYKAQQLLAERGVTAVADMGTTIDDWQAYRRAGDRGGLHIRIMAYAVNIPDMVVIGGPGPSPWLYDDHLRLNGVAMSVDGSLANREAVLKAPYADEPGSRGTFRYGDTQFRNMMSRAALDEFQPALAASGDGGVSEALDTITELVLTYKGERRWRIEGTQAIDPIDIPRFVQHGAIASFQPERLARERSLAETRLGADRLARVQPWNALATAGVKLAFGSGAVDQLPFSPFAGMAAAVTREDGAGQPFGGWQPQERITREQAFAAYTLNGAFAGFADGRFGTITPGARADFLFVDKDPLLASPAELRIIKVLETWVGGAKIYETNAPAAAVSEAKLEKAGEGGR